MLCPLRPPVHRVLLQMLDLNGIGEARNVSIQDHVLHREISSNGYAARHIYST